LPPLRVAEHAEALDAEPVGDRGHVARPVEQPPVRHAGGEPEAGPVESDEPHARAGEGRVEQREVEPRAGQPVEVQDGRAAGIAEQLDP
jgi:hypothetical protein